MSPHFILVRAVRLLYPIYKMLSKLSLLVSFLALDLIVAQCGTSKVKLGIEVKYDGSSSQTTFQLDGTTLPVSQQDNQLVSFFRCVDPGTLHKIAVKDADGLSGSAYASISINDRLIASISEFTSEVVYYFVGDRQVCDTGDARFVLDLKFDSSPAQTLWTLTKTSTNQNLISQTVVGDSAALGNQFLTVDKCLDAGPYSFSIVDGNGISSPGFYRVFIESTLLAVGGGDQGFTGTSTTSFVVASVTPTAAPTPIASSDPCDDEKLVTFFINATIGNVRCRWLQTRPGEQPIYCKPDHPSNAYNICEETCGKCSDACEDSPGTFVANNGVSRSCYWLADDPVNRQPLYCKPGTTAYTLCEETCDNCA